MAVPVFPVENNMKIEKPLAVGTWQVSIQLEVNRTPPKCIMRLNGSHVHTFEETDFSLCPATTAQDGLVEIDIPESWGTMLHHLNVMSNASVLTIETSVPCIWHKVWRMQ